MEWIFVAIIGVASVGFFFLSLIKNATDVRDAQGDYQRTHQPVSENYRRQEADQGLNQAYELPAPVSIPNSKEQ
jgi:hypothetical protein